MKYFFFHIEGRGELFPPSLKHDCLSPGFSLPRFDLILFFARIREHSQHDKLFDITYFRNLGAEYETVALKKDQASSLADRIPEILNGLQDYRLGKSSGTAICRVVS